MPRPPIVVISADKNGVFNQCLALCEDLGWPPAETIKIVGKSRVDTSWARLKNRIERGYAIFKYSPRRKSSDYLRIVASGNSSEALVAAYRKIYGDKLFALFIGVPKWKKPIYDLAIASNHERVSDVSSFAGARKTIWMSGVFVRALKAARSTPKNSTLAILIGGVNKAFELDPRRLGDQIESVVGGSAAPMTKVSIIFSRRTSLDIEQELRARFVNQPFSMIDRTDRAGFEEAVSEAAQYLVTPDSITMICEVCFLNRPVIVFDLECTNPNTSTARFVDEFVKNHCIVKFGRPNERKPVESLAAANRKIVSSIAASYDRWAAPELAETRG